MRGLKGYSLNGGGGTCLHVLTCLRVEISNQVLKRVV